MAHAYNLSTQEAKAGRLPVPHQPELRSKFKAALDCPQKRKTYIHTNNNQKKILKTSLIEKQERKKLIEKIIKLIETSRVVVYIRNGKGDQCTSRS